MMDTGVARQLTRRRPWAAKASSGPMHVPNLSLETARQAEIRNEGFKLFLVQRGLELYVKGEERRAFDPFKNRWLTPEEVVQLIRH